MKELEDEPDLLAAQPRQAILVERGDVDAVDQDLAARRGVEAGDQAEQRGLAAAGRTDDGEALPRRHRQVQRMQDRERLIAALDGLADAAQLDHRALAPACASSGSSDAQTRSATIRAPRAFG